MQATERYLVTGPCEAVTRPTTSDESSVTLLLGLGGLRATGSANGLASFDAREVFQAYVTKMHGEASVQDLETMDRLRGRILRYAPGMGFVVSDLLEVLCGMQPRQVKAYMPSCIVRTKFPSLDTVPFTGRRLLTMNIADAYMLLREVCPGMVQCSEMHKARF